MMEINFKKINHIQIIKEDTKMPGFNRFLIFDFWDNRIELLEKE